MEAHDRAVIESRHAMQWEVTIPKSNGLRTALVVKFPVYDNAGNIASIGAILADITDQKRAELELAQSQRMEALGQLTGGIAHDFNNLLTAILLNADVLASVLDDRMRPLAEAVRMAAERGADLTRRLLAFGRRQILEPRPTDVRELLAGMEPLMHRTLGAPIEVKSRHAADLWFATIDPSQLENAVLNLAFNARDAMPDGGRLTIETANVEFDDEQAEGFPGSKAGQYVMIAVGDTGCGMPPDVVARAFEPFFTTKDVGKGTGPRAQHGLRLRHAIRRTCAHLFGSRDRHGGAALSAALDDGAGRGGCRARAPAELPTGKETILFVEDDPMVRQHTGEQIVGLGYAIMMAENASEAITLVDDGYVPDLLFTDVVMPGGMNGRQLALKLRQRWPELRVLYTSGYAHGQLTIDGESVPSKYVLGKPYRRADLAAKLREVLDEPAGPGVLGERGLTSRAANGVTVAPRPRIHRTWPNLLRPRHSVSRTTSPASRGVQGRGRGDRQFRRRASRPSRGDRRRGGARGRARSPAIAVTFEPHPRNVLRPSDPVFRLTDARSKLRLLATTGLDGALVLTFDKAFAALSAEEFVSHILVGRLGIRGATIGFDFHFGHRRRGSPAFLSRAGRAARLHGRDRAAAGRRRPAGVVFLDPCRAGRGARGRGRRTARLSVVRGRHRDQGRSARARPRLSDREHARSIRTAA